MKQRTRNLNMTEGEIWKVILLFFLPMMAGNLLQQLYATVDAIIVGRFVGKTGLAAIDAIAALLRLPGSAFAGLGGGATILISQYFGAGNREDLDKAVHTSVLFSLIGGAILSVIGVLIAPMCLDLLKVPGELRGQALSYMRIYFAGFLVTMSYYMSAGTLRAMGDSQTPFVSMAVSCVLNIVLDIFMVGKLGMGTAGAALATVISQSLSMLLNFRALANPGSPAPMALSRLRIDRQVLGRTLRLGVPLSLQAAVYPIANMALQTAVNLTGTDNIAALALCFKLDMIIWMCADSLPSALATFVAQNHGAGLAQRARQGTRTTMAMSIALVGALSVILYFGTAWLGRFFIPESDWSILPLAGKYMHLMAPFYWTYVVGECLSATVRGLGDTFRPMLITVVGTCGLRLGWVAFVVPLNPVIETILWAYPLSWLVTSLLFVGYFTLFRRKQDSPAKAKGT